MKIAVGIDPSIHNTGVVVLGESGSKLPPECLLESIIQHKKLLGIPRLMAICHDVMYIVHSFNPQAIVIEGYSLNMKNATSVIPLVELGSMLRFMMHLDGLEWYAPKAPTLKKFVTGKGNSPKDHVMMHVLKRWGHTSKSNDTADAYGLACMGLLIEGALLDYTQEQDKIISEIQSVRG